MKLIKSSDEKARLRAEAEQKKQQAIIDAVTEKEKKRQQEIDKIDNEYGNAMQMYTVRCQQRGANAPALIRLLLLSKHDIRRYSPQEWDGLIASFGLTAWAEELNRLCPPEKPPVKRKLPDLSEDD